MGRKKPTKTGDDLDSLLHRLETVSQECAPDKTEKTPEEDLDEFSKLRKQAARQVSEIRKLINERDELLEASSGSGGAQSVTLSHKIRQTIKEAHETHKAMQNFVAQEEKDRERQKAKGAKGNLPLLTPEEVDEHLGVVDLTLKHITECEQLEKKRYQSRTAGRQGRITGRAGGTEMKEVKRAAADTDLADIDPEIGQGLAQLQANDQVLDQQLELVGKGVTRLKGIAQDQAQEIRLQGVMIDQIDQNMDNATEHLQHVNTKMKDVLKNAGGAMSIVIKICLLILVVAVFGYLYRMLA